MGLRVLPPQGPDDGSGRVRSAPAVRGDLSRRDWRPARARSHLGLGADPAAAPALRTIRQSAADASAARRRHAARGPDDGRYRHGLRAGKLRRASTPGSAGACTSARRTRWPSRRAFSRATASSESRGSRSRWHPSARDASSPARPSPTRCSIRWCCGTRSSKRSRRIIQASSGGSITWTPWPRA